MHAMLATRFPIPRTPYTSFHGAKEAKEAARLIAVKHPNTLLSWTPSEG